MPKFNVTVAATKAGSVHMNHGERRTYTVEAKDEHEARMAAIDEAYEEGGLEHVLPFKVTPA